MSGVEIRQMAALKGHRGGRNGQEGQPYTLCIGLAGVLAFLHSLHYFSIRSESSLGAI